MPKSKLGQAQAEKGGPTPLGDTPFAGVVQSPFVHFAQHAWEQGEDSCGQGDEESALLAGTDTTQEAAKARVAWYKRREVGSPAFVPCMHA